MVLCNLYPTCHQTLFIYVSVVLWIPIIFSGLESISMIFILNLFRYSLWEPFQANFGILLTCPHYSLGMSSLSDATDVPVSSYTF